MSHLSGFIMGVVSSIVATILLNYISDKYSYRFSFRRILKSVLKLYEKIQQDGYMPDYIIGIDRNGCIVGSMLSGYFGPTPVITASVQTVRNVDGSRKVFLSEAHMPPHNALRDKNILIVACFVDTGSALEIVYNYYSSLEGRPNEIRTASLFTTLAPRFKPKYYVFEIGKNINASAKKIMRGMPWMTKGWKFVLADER